MIISTLSFRVFIYVNRGLSTSGIRQWMKNRSTDRSEQVPKSIKIRRMNLIWSLSLKVIQIAMLEKEAFLT